MVDMSSRGSQTFVIKPTHINPVLEFSPMSPTRCHVDCSKDDMTDQEKLIGNLPQEPKRPKRQERIKDQGNDSESKVVFVLKLVPPTALEPFEHSSEHVEHG